MSRLLTAACLAFTILTVAGAPAARAHDEAGTARVVAAGVKVRDHIGRIEQGPAAAGLGRLDEQLRPLVQLTAGLDAHDLAALVDEVRKDGEAERGEWRRDAAVAALGWEHEFGTACSGCLGVWYQLHAGGVQDRARAVAYLRRAAPASALGPVAKKLASSRLPDLRFHAARLASQVHTEGNGGAAMRVLLENLAKDQEPAVASATLRGPVVQARCAQMLGLALGRVRDDREIRVVPGVPECPRGTVGDAARFAVREIVYLSPAPDGGARLPNDASMAEIERWASTAGGVAALDAEFRGPRPRETRSVELKVDSDCTVELAGTTIRIRVAEFSERWNGSEFRQSMRIDVSEEIDGQPLRLFTVQGEDQSEDWSPASRGRWARHATADPDGTVRQLMDWREASLAVTGRRSAKDPATVLLHLRLRISD